MTDPPATDLRRFALCFAPFAGAYFLSYLYRGLNAVIGPDLVAEFALGPAELGLMTSVYFAAFALCQLPLGVALDRWGPRRVNAALLLVCTVGAVVFAFAQGFAMLALGRFLIGLGLAAGLMASFKANVQFWPRARLPMVNGLTMVAGSLGAFAATLPLQGLLALVDWRGVLLLLAVLTLASAASLMRFVPELHQAGGGPSLRAQVASVGVILRARAFWHVVPAMVTCQAVYLSYVFLWAAPWLRDVGGLDRVATAWHLGLLTAMMATGYYAVGWVTSRLTARGLPIARLFAAYIGLFVAVQVPLALQVAAPPALLWALFGLCGGGSIMGFTILQQHFPAEQAGRVSTCGNLIIFVLAFLIQWGVGVAVEAFGTGPGATLAHGHLIALVTLVAMQAAGFLWLLAAPGSRAEH